MPYGAGGAERSGERVAAGGSDGGAVAGATRMSGGDIENAKGETGGGTVTSFVHTHSLILCVDEIPHSVFITERNYMPDVRTSHYFVLIR
jgi:hypothetical protein